MKNCVLIIGAKSDIAKEIAKIYAKNGFDLYLACRNSENLANLAKDIKIRSNAKVGIFEFDISKFETHAEFYANLDPKPVGVIVVAGYMANQQICEQNWRETLNTINVNFIGAVSILNIVANDMEEQKNGFIIGISSVAGDRGRKTNYIYGSTKAAFSVYLSGLRNRLFQSGVKVLSVKPGFVNTKMTAGMNLPPNLTAQPDKVALDIFKAQQKGKDIIYTKSIWKYIMMIIKLIPESKFKRMSI